VSGLPSVFADLTGRLSAAVSSYGIAYPAAASLEDLVETLVRVLLERSAGPYYLAGHSIGAAVCFEIARKLEALGHKTRIALLDRPTERAAFTEPMEHYIDRLLAGVIASARKELEERIRCYRTMIGSYRPEGAIQGDLLAIEARDAGHPAHMHGWNSHTRGLFRHQFSGGDHDSMLRAPHAEGLAAILSEWFGERESNQ